MKTGCLNHYTERPLWNAKKLGAASFPSTVSLQNGQVLVAQTGLTATHLRDYLFQGFDVSSLNNTTTVTVSAGRALTTIGGEQVVVLGNTLIKNLAAAWVQGTNQGGRFMNVTFAAGTYHVFLIFNPTTGVVDVGFDNNPFASNRPVGWFARRISSLMVVATPSLVIQSYLQHQDYIELQTPTQVLSATFGASRTNYTLPVPAGLQWIVRGIVGSGTAHPTSENGCVSVYMQSPHTSNYAFDNSLMAGGVVDSTVSAFAYNGDYVSTATELWCLTNTNRQIAVTGRGSYIGSLYWNTTLQLQGWLDPNVRKGL